MTGERTYTLDEAAAELARRECAAHGHSWNVVQDAAGCPVRVFCDNCGVGGAVTMGAAL